MRATMSLFKDYLRYGEPRMSISDIKNMDKETFSTLKNYYFKKIEGYELDATFDEFKAYVESMEE